MKNALHVLAETDVQAHATAKVFARGVRYAEEGAVGRLVLRGDELFATVRGTDVRPYRVRVRCSDEAVREVRCSCPYEWEGWCKHVVAVLLVGQRQPERVAERPPLAEPLGALGADALRRLVLDLAERHPRLIPTIEKWIARENNHP